MCFALSAPLDSLGTEALVWKRCKDCLAMRMQFVISKKGNEWALTHVFAHVYDVMS